VLPEESIAAWSPTQYKNDYYPRLKVRIDGREVVDDFDTGAMMTMVSSDIVKKGELNFTMTASTGSHLGAMYSYFPARASIEIQDGQGNWEARKMPLAVVEDWGNSPFIRINRTRSALIGRDILRAFPVEITLNTASRTTTVRLI
jgi:hypothetical protein